ncbi:MAG: hypothetical protein JST81_03895 [Bacteroidetes bacterium]|nr:hypothetical protein [Bacteroidota bacterium]
MGQLTKSILLIGILAGNMLMSFADRGVGKKSKNKINLNIPANTNLRNSLSYNLNNGLKYKGSLITGVQKGSGLITSNNIVTYQKGSNIYIIPYKQKVIVPEIKQGYTGMKLIIK